MITQQSSASNAARGVPPLAEALHRMSLQSQKAAEFSSSIGHLALKSAMTSATTTNSATEQHQFHRYMQAHQAHNQNYHQLQQQKSSSDKPAIAQASKPTENFFNQI